MSPSRDERRERDPLPVATRFPDWATPRYEETVKQLRNRLLQQHPRFWVLADRILLDAECARAWKEGAAAKPPVLDPYEAKRRSDAEYIASLEPQIDAARRIAGHLMRRQDALRSEVALSHALHDAAITLGWTPPDPHDGGGPGRSPLGGWPWPARDVLAHTLLAYANRLERTPLGKRGPWEHRFRVGPLLFKEPVDQHPARPDRATCLLFGTAFWARWLSVTDLRLRPFVGTRMPKPMRGRPPGHWRSPS